MKALTHSLSGKHQHRCLQEEPKKEERQAEKKIRHPR